MTTVVFGLIGVALIVAIPVACLLLGRRAVPEHKGEIAELITVGGREFRITQMTTSARGEMTIALEDRASFDARHWVRA